VGGGLRGRKERTAVIDWRERKPYWRHTKLQMAATLVPVLIGLLVLPLYAEVLNAKRVLGIPLGFFLLCHGLLVIVAIVAFAWVNRQDAIDRWHGAGDDA
jgi:putative solute:sodium symporter small subunit